jgi:hypothetical protein
MSSPSTAFRQIPSDQTSFAERYSEDGKQSTNDEGGKLEQPPHASKKPRVAAACFKSAFVSVKLNSIGLFCHHSLRKTAWESTVKEMWLINAFILAAS